jgi:hypothetical protein
MLSNLSIGAVGTGAGFQEPNEARVAVPVQAQAASASPDMPNPTLWLDPALGLVVIEFVGKADAVTSSIPSQHQLNAYRDGTASPPGNLPHQSKKPEVVA